MSLTRIGPIPLTHYNPAFVWTSTPDQRGWRSTSISGRDEWDVVRQLSELVANQHRRIGFAEQVGVLVHVYADDALLREFNGWYLLQSCQVEGSQQASVTELVGFTVEAVYLGGHRSPVVVRSSRELDTDLVTGQALIVSPFEAEDSEGDEFVVPPGGTFTSREYDPTLHDPRTLTPAGGGRELGLYVGDVDELDAVCLPSAETDTLTTPEWMLARGQDVRAWDRRSEREVYGPAHPFQAPTDITLTNGLIRFTVGNRGVIPYLSVEAFTDDDWVFVGHLFLAEVTDETPLVGARLIRVTPDVATVQLDARGLGTILCTLHRGQRGIYVEHGLTRQPTISAHRTVRWNGTPPYTSLTGAVLEPGGQLDGAIRTDAATVSLIWPREALAAAWTVDGYWIPNGGSDEPAAIAEWGDGAWGDGVWGGALVDDQTILELHDSAGEVASLIYDASAQALVYTVDTDSVSVTLADFTAGTAFWYSLRFSTTDGITLDVRREAGVQQTATDPAATSLGTADATLTAVVLGDYGAHDTLRIYNTHLTDSEVADLAVATTRGADLPTPEAHLIWAAPFDTDPIPAGTTSVPGRIAGPPIGAFTPVVVSLAADSQSGVGLDRVHTSFSVAAFLTLDEDYDRPADVHAQFAAANDQQLRIR